MCRPHSKIQAEGFGEAIEVEGQDGSADTVFLNFFKPGFVLAKIRLAWLNQYALPDGCTGSMIFSVVFLTLSNNTRSLGFRNRANRLDAELGLFGALMGSMPSTLAKPIFNYI